MNKITSSVDYNYWLKSLDTSSLNQPIELFKSTKGLVWRAWWFNLDDLIWPVVVLMLELCFNIAQVVLCWRSLPPVEMSCSSVFTMMSFPWIGSVCLWSPSGGGTSLFDLVSGALCLRSSCHWLDLEPSPILALVPARLQHTELDRHRTVHGI